MSASGKRTSAHVRVMSALPPKADIDGPQRDVRFVPEADFCAAANNALFDHLVGAGEQRRWYGEAKRFCGSEVYREFEFCW